LYEAFFTPVTYSYCGVVKNTNITDFMFPELGEEGWLKDEIILQ